QAHVRRSVDKGRVVKEEELESGKVVTTTEYTYDDRGRLARAFERHVASGSIGAYTLATEYGWDDAGHVVRMTEQEVDGGKDLGKKETTYKYDAAGHLVEPKPAIVEKPPQVTRDAAGRVTKVVFEDTGSGSEQRLATYDDKGRMTTLNLSKHHDSSGHAWSEVYEMAFTWDGPRLTGEKEKMGGGDGLHGFNADAETTYSYDGKG